LAAINGDDVLVDASNANTVTYGGTITADKSVTLFGALSANTVTVTLDATRNDVSAALTGGIGDDVFTFTLANATNDITSLNVTGGIGSDTLFIDNSAGAVAVTTPVCPWRPLMC